MLLSRSRLCLVTISTVLSIFTTLAVGTNANALGTSPKKFSQAPLNIGADKIPVVGGSLVLSSSGGSGTGYITYKLAVENSACHIRGNILRTYIPTTCWVYVSKSADTQFLVARSSSVQFIFRLPQNALTLSVPNSATANEAVSAEVTGGNGDGAVSLRLLQPNSMCQLNELALTITGSGACKIFAHKDGNAIYAPIDSDPVTVDSRPAYPSLSMPRLYITLGASAPYPGLKLTVLEGGWSPDSAPESLGYRWLRDGQTIPGENTRDYVVTAQDAGKSLAAEVTFNNHLYASVSWKTEPSLPTLRLLNSSIPEIVGKKLAGQRLTAMPGRWVVGTTFTYKWYRDGVRISGANSRQYKLTSQDIAKNIQVLVTGTKSGYRAVSHLSTSTWRPQQQNVYEAISSLASVENSTSVPEVQITAAPGVNQQWLARETASIQRGVNLFTSFRQPTTVEVIYVTAQDVEWAEQLFSERGYNIYRGIRWWMERDGCNIALSWTEQQHPVFIQCLGPGRESATYQQIGAHEYAHLIQGQYSLAHSVMPGWLTEGSASFFGLASAVYDQGLDMAGVDQYLASYAGSNYSYDVAARLPQGSQQILHYMQDGNVPVLTEVLNWSSDYGLLYVHTQFLLGGLLTEWLISKYGLAKMQELYATTDQELSTYLPFLWVERRAKVKQTFKDVYGLDWPELLTEAAPYLSARASQLLQISYQ